DMGLQVHLTSRIRAAAAVGDTALVRHVIGIGLGLYLAACAAGGACLLTAVLAFGLTERLGLRAEGADAAAILVGAVALVLLPRGLVACVFSSRGQATREVGLATAQQLCWLLGPVAAALLGGGLVEAAAAQLAASIAVGWVALILALRRHHPDIRLSVVWPEAEERRSTLRRSTLHAVSSLPGILLLHLPVLALKQVFPTGTEVVVFSTMRTFAGLLRQVQLQLAIIAVLEMTRQHAQGDSVGLVRMFRAISRFCSGLLGLAAAFMFAVGASFFETWTHGTVVFDPWLALAFLLPILGSVPAFCGTALLRHTDHAEDLLRMHLAQLALGLVLGAALLPWGPAGVAAALAVAELAAVGAAGIRRCAKVFGFPAGRVVVSSATTAAAATAASAIACILLSWAVPPRGIVGLAAYGACWAAAMAPLSCWLLVDAEQRAMLARAAALRLPVLLRLRRT
ncbi:MAG TPA: hypothetical protein VEB20_02520, partial [Azospirillaceae bacterium]|nr:hypothetical protein [Azospirillaceae bacterium]